MGMHMDNYMTFKVNFVYYLSLTLKKYICIFNYYVSFFGDKNMRNT